MSKIDWHHLAEELGTITWTEHGRNESGSADLARQAIVKVIGDSALRDAVDYYVSGQPGNELARQVLWLLGPPTAMERCLEVFRASEDMQEAANAIELLQVVADARVLNWVPEILGSENEVARSWGIGIVDQLLWTEQIELSQAMPLIEIALSDSYEPVRSRAQQVLDMQAQRAGK